MPVIGTAGHVDHGKSALIEALTGVHPDRLREEQERGLTIELGFGWMTLPSGVEASIVDVPGHVRFVRHMLAGAGAIDIVLFVIAADEGVMPQTREHLEILDLLGIEHGVVALTKCDLVDDDWVDLVAEDVAELLAETSLGDMPIVRVSSIERTGLDELQAALDTALATAPRAEDIGRPRLGIDRVFTMTGFGTVVTGTLLGGTLRIGDNVEAAPGGPTGRIRGLQTHRRGVEEAHPGTRVAANLAGVATEALRRGQVLAPPGRMIAARTLDARLRVLRRRPLKHNARVTLHLGTAEVQARVRVMGGDEVPAGGEGWCQIVLGERVAAVPGDLFVLRVSDETVAGGRVIEVNAPRHRRNDGETIARMESRAAGTPESRIIAALERGEFATEDALQEAVEVEADELRETLGDLVDRGNVHALRTEPSSTPLYATAGTITRLHDRAAQLVATYHEDFPLRFVMPREELRSRLELSQRAFAAMLSGAIEGLEATSEGVRRSGWQPEPAGRDRAQIDEALATLNDGGLQPPRLQLDPEHSAYLTGGGFVVDCGDGVLIGAEQFDRARAQVVELLERERDLTLARARDALGTNRRVAQAFLETLDRQGVTRREGDRRLLRSRPGGDGTDSV